MDLIGEVVGSYRVVRELGRGGMGAVYLAEHTLIGRSAALKVLQPQYSFDQRIVTRFFNEAKVVSAIRHPGIVEIYDFGYHTADRAYLVMEYLQGETLEARLRRQGRMSARQAQALTRQIAGALSAAHRQGVVHRDLKPDNVFVVPDPDVGGGERIKILDFGIAKLIGDQANSLKTRTGAVMGTPTYMAPEQCRGRGDVDHRADLYALGCILCKMVTGRPPFIDEGSGELIVSHVTKPPPTPSQLAPGIEPDMDALILRLLAKEPEQRYATTQDVIAVIDAMAEGGARVAPEAPARRSPKDAAASSDTTLSAGALALTPASTPSATAEAERRRRRVWALAALVAVAGLVALSILIGDGQAPESASSGAWDGGSAAALTGVSERDAASGEPPAQPDQDVDGVERVEAVNAGSEAGAPDGAVEAERVALSVRSTPEQAELFVDGERYGVTPADLELPRIVGQRVVTVRLEGYEESATAIGGDEDAAVTVHLEPRPSAQTARDSSAKRPAQRTRTAPRRRGGNQRNQGKPHDKGIDADKVKPLRIDL